MAALPTSSSCHIRTHQLVHIRTGALLCILAILCSSSASAAPSATRSGMPGPRDPFLHLLKRSLLGETFAADLSLSSSTSAVKESASASTSASTVSSSPYPLLAATMVDATGFTALEMAVEAVTREAVPGHYIEAGVWRGGLSIYAAALFRHYETGNEAFNRTVFLADSFQGLPLATTSSDSPLWFLEDALRVTEVRRFKCVGETLQYGCSTEE